MILVGGHSIKLTSYLGQVTEAAIVDEKLRDAARGKRYEDCSLFLKEWLRALFIERMEGNKEAFIN